MQHVLPASSRRSSRFVLEIVLYCTYYARTRTPKCAATSRRRLDHFEPNSPLRKPMYLHHLLIFVLQRGVVVIVGLLLPGAPPALRLRLARPRTATLALGKHLSSTADFISFSFCARETLYRFVLAFASPFVLLLLARRYLAFCLLDIATRVLLLQRARRSTTWP